MKGLLKGIAAATIALITTPAIGQIQVKQMVTVAESQKDLSAKRLNVNAQFCKINLTPSASDQITFNGKMEAMEEADGYRINVEETDGIASISVDHPTDPKSSYAGELTIGLTADASIEITTTSGNVNITDIKGANIKIETAKGKVTIRNCESSIDAETKNGDINVTNYTGKLSATSSAGKVNITDAKGDITFETSDGSTTATNIEGTLSGKTIAGTQTYDNIKGNLNIQGSTGAIKVSNADIVLKANTKGATINFFKVTAEMHVTSEKGQIISAASANGVRLTASSDFTTTEGKISLTLLNKKEELKFDLEHAQKGDIGLIAKGERTTKKQLKCGTGSIVVTGRTNTGTQTYK